MGVIMKISFGIFALVLMIYSVGQVRAEDEDKVDFLDNRRIAPLTKGRLWKQRIIPFEISTELSSTNRLYIRTSMRLWESKICVKFVNYDENQHSSYLSFIKSKKCKSRLGKYQEGLNVIRINEKCSYLSTMREIGHALGFSFSDEPEYKKLEDRSETEKTLDMFYECQNANLTKSMNNRDESVSEIEPIETNSLKDNDKNANETEPMKDNAGKTDENNVNKTKPLENNENSSNKTNLMEDNNKNINKTKSLKDNDNNANQTNLIENDDKNTNETTNSNEQMPTKEIDFDDFDIFSMLLTSKVAVNNSRRWDKGIIPFVIENGFNWGINRVIATAMRFWESETCIKFVVRDENQHPNYLSFIKSDRCESQFGRHQKGANIVHMSDDCGIISIGREIGHAMGLVFKSDPEHINFEEDPRWGWYFECPRNIQLQPIPECGGTFTDPTGLIEVPDEFFKSSFIKCEWRIYGSRSDKIVLDIEGIDVYESPRCLTDYLEVRDGYWSESPLLGHYCGRENVTLLKSQSDRMLITYVKRSTSFQGGFRARFYKTCGGDIEINNNTVYLESPNYPWPIESDSQCIWNISYPQDKTLEIITYDFWLEESSDCEKNFLEIHDSKSLIGRYCGDRMPNKTMLTGGKARVDFVGKNWTNDYSGFSILVRAVETETPVPGSASYQSFNMSLISTFLLLLYIYAN